MPSSKENAKRIVYIIPLGYDFTCPYCGERTDYWEEKMKCNCHKEYNFVVSFGGENYLSEAKT